MRTPFAGGPPDIPFDGTRPQNTPRNPRWLAFSEWPPSPTPTAWNSYRGPWNDGGGTARSNNSENDYRWAWQCRRLAEERRHQWLTGRAQEIAFVMARARAGDRRFRGRDPHELALIGRLRWSQSPAAERLVRLEQMYLHWSRTYLAFAEHRPPSSAAGTGAAAPLLAPTTPTGPASGDGRRPAGHRRLHADLVLRVPRSCPLLRRYGARPHQPS